MAAYHLFAAIFVVLFLGLKANEDNLADITDQEIKDYLEKYPGDVSLFPLNRDGQFQASTDFTGYWRTTTTTRPRYRQTTTTTRPRYRRTTTDQPRYRRTTTDGPRYRRTTTDRPRYRRTTTAQPWYRRTTTTTRPWYRRTRTTTRPLYRQTTIPTQPWNMHRRITTNRPWYRHKGITTQARWNLQITNPWGYLKYKTTQSLLNGLSGDTDLPRFGFPTQRPILPAENASNYTTVGLSLTGLFVIMVTIFGIRCAVAKSRRRRLLAQTHGQTQSGVIVRTVAPTSRNQQLTTSRRCNPIGAIVIVRRVLCIRARPLADDGDEGQLIPAEPVSPPTYEQTVTAPVSEDTAPPPYSSLPPAYTEV